VQQVVQRQPLGEFAELVAPGRTDQPVQALPQVAVFGQRRNLLQQGLLALVAPGIVIQPGAGGSHLFAEGSALRFQRL
jgi:tRNA U38,U39,U40 pseudouridine synthase TruA